MTSFILKIIAAVTMLIDHAGLILLSPVTPVYAVSRIIGRLAFPIYAYCIAEGFRYTRDRRKYFLRIFILGVLCQIVYTIVEQDIYLGILLTFSLSILLMSIQDQFLKNEDRKKLLWGMAYAVSVAAVFLLTRFITVDYGFFGVMLPVVTALFPDKPRRLLAFTLCLTSLSIEHYTLGSSTQFFSLAALIPLILYNGKQGRYKLKYFFYLFYPIHMVVLYGIDVLLKVM